MKNLDKLFAAIITDYERCSAAAIAAGNTYVVDRVQNMKSGKILYVETGRKYIRVVLDNSVWGFIVNTHNDPKFKYGDILLAAGWKAPAKNHARGNVIDCEFNTVSWAGPAYCK